MQRKMKTTHTIDEFLFSRAKETSTGEETNDDHAGADGRRFHLQAQLQSSQLDHVALCFTHTSFDSCSISPFIRKPKKAAFKVPMVLKARRILQIYTNF